MTHPYFDPAQAAVFNELSTARDSTFEVSYFGLHGFAGVTRTILAAGGANFKNYVPADWATEKPSAPFGVIPLLKETSKDGSKTIHVAESDAIERYLAKKFGFTGANAFEETLVNTYAAHTTALFQQCFLKYFGTKDEEVKAKAKADMASGSIPGWVNFHEKYLAANGSNGHYVGDKTSLADIKTYHILGLLQSLTGEDLISESKTPAIWKVKTTLESMPSVRAWRETEDFKAFSEKNLNFLGYP
ncbi:hypothetical protein BC939DRAFT_450685 [Gamsiella multidivaricata]|uniref:uncharacterized protein n=1 Tax=Gamsiella multidivaricata TaxID=101098 RepID=UPI00221EACCF|nr:uncharacterized protein BC939DRAFT_450685 [Gamsiella multidivaricata]KAG0352830.1 Glutathione S-transferase S1 [Gamsiella multidivaricata]KAI7824130.1 hypothetical protein BC939DRAFT_450685 [Gamsiella multidivaricata]